MVADAMGRGLVEVGKAAPSSLELQLNATAWDVPPESRT